MVKIYYDKENGYLCNRYPKDIPVNEDTPFIEVEDDIAEKTYCCENGKFWAVVDGELKLVEDKEVTSSKEWKIEKLEEQIREKQQYLFDTDYIVIKIYEASIEYNTELELELKETYKNELTQRKQCRKEINILEEELKKLKS